MSFLLFGLLKIWIDNLLPSEEMPHSSAVELVSEGVEDGIEKGVGLRQDWKHLGEETIFPYFFYIT